VCWVGFSEVAVWEISGGAGCIKGFEGEVEVLSGLSQYLGQSEDGFERGELRGWVDQ
jgi:hypothetical protein